MDSNGLPIQLNKELTGELPVTARVRHGGDPRSERPSLRRTDAGSGGDRGGQILRLIDGELNDPPQRR